MKKRVVGIFFAVENNNTFLYIQKLNEPEKSWEIKFLSKLVFESYLLDPLTVSVVANDIFYYVNTTIL